MSSSATKRVIAISPVKGRGTGSNNASRYEAWSRETDADYLETHVHDEVSEQLETTVKLEQARSVISRNNSPDIHFDQSINPYQGCEHGCVYCFARPTHAYLGLSPGIDFETKIFAKSNAAELLRKELSRRGHVPTLIALGANTDPYQPAEKELGISRAVLQVLSEFNHPVGITTKSALVTRDIDLLAPMAEKGLVRVAISIGTLDHALARKLEPRANSPTRRMKAVQELAAAGVPTGVLVAPIIPALNDVHLEQVMQLAAQSGAVFSGYTLLRLPLELRDLFVEWLETHYPLRAKHVMSIVKQMRGGADYNAEFGVRMRGTGQFAELLAQRFQLACRRFGLNGMRAPINTSLFRVPAAPSDQLDLF
jgi:DNA repair photolyase